MRFPYILDKIKKDKGQRSFIYTNKWETFFRCISFTYINNVPRGLTNSHGIRDICILEVLKCANFLKSVKVIEYNTKVLFLTEYFNILPSVSVSVSSDEDQIEMLNRSATSLTPTGSPNLPSSLSPLEEDGDPLLQSQSALAEAASSTKEQAVFSSVLTVRADSDSLVQYPAPPHANAYNLTNRKLQEDPPAKASQAPTKSALSTGSGTVWCSVDVR